MTKTKTMDTYEYLQAIRTLNRQEFELYCWQYCRHATEPTKKVIENNFKNFLNVEPYDNEQSMLESIKTYGN